MMKKTLLTTLILVVSFASFAQEGELGKNELKINMSNLIGFKWLDLGYERILNEESSYGIGALVSLDHDIEGLDEYRTFSLTPYYRHFFSNKYAQGFFVEAFTMLHSGKSDDNDIYYDNSTGSYITKDNNSNYTDFAVGISVGAKWVTKRGFVAEIYGGLGRDMFDQSDNEIVGRGGISIGYRFQ